jgi:hypothetical protein
MLSALAIVLVGLLAFNNTPSVHADGSAPAPTADPSLTAVIPPLNKTMNAKYINGIQAAKVPAARKLLPLNASKQFPLSVIPQGSGSGLNADTLDSLDSSAFALAGHNHFGQTWAGKAGIALNIINTQLSQSTEGLAGQVDSPIDGSMGVVGWASANSGAVYGVWGLTSSSKGAGIYATGAGSSGTALRIENGGIQVAGAGKGTNTPAFVQVATGGVGGNINANNTKITNSLTDGDPNAILIVTPNFNPGGGSGVVDANSVGVFYDGTNWEIYNIDNVAMAPGRAFNVLVIKP